MSTEIELELHKQFKAAQERYIYFLLAVSVSAIGYAITQIKVEPFNLNHIAFALSITLWSLSFISGLKFAQLTVDSTFKNMIYLFLKRELKNYPEHTELISKYKSDLLNSSQNRMKKLAFYGGLQSMLLLLGALSYICWHGLLILSVTP
ncbi:hypothetical protein [Rheinheimera sp. EpRS3]|uniref:hypothetical protein n=1 Tax=Rheinheimera sp. EpRS3 TaxID=1712383 RepID=UPI0007467B1F|nr:hypothetical protein [Rheinheimera sp. EpRS3]KUM51865.1 hypothetical protein AR688_00670 [Rheinheimera sp. EpRS3]